VEPQTTVTISGATEYTILPAHDVATFDLGFSLEEDENDEDILDASCDLFEKEVYLYISYSYNLQIVSLFTKLCSVGTLKHKQ